MAKIGRIGAFQDVGKVEVVDQAGVQPVQNLSLDRIPNRSAAERQQGQPDGEAKQIATERRQDVLQLREAVGLRVGRDPREVGAGPHVLALIKVGPLVDGTRIAVDEVEEGLVVRVGGGGDVPLEVSDHARLLGRLGELHRLEGIDPNCAGEALFKVLQRAIGGLVGAQRQEDVAARPVVQVADEGISALASRATSGDFSHWSRKSAIGRLLIAATAATRSRACS